MLPPPPPRRARRANLWRSIATLAVVIASLAVLATARVFSGTVDEPAHIASGMQWLSTGQYTYDLPHPPLARVVVALGPYFHGVRTIGAPGVFDEGAALLGNGRHYVDTLASARHGTLIFLLLLVAVVWTWSRRLTGEAGAAAAVLLVVTNPNILAHAGLATTDLACAATTTLALLTSLWWSDSPTARRTLVLGLAFGLALGTRLSAIAFLAAPLAVLYVVHRIVTQRWAIASDGSAARELGSIARAMLVAFVVVLALYRFQPAPLIGGLRTFFLHGSSGHPTFLLGRASNRGWWYYFPVALLVKTPLPLLLLSLVGAAASVLAVRNAGDWQAAAPLVCALAILAVSMPVRVDLGVRLVLPIYPLLAIAGAQGAMMLIDRWDGALSRTTVGALLAASVWIVVRAHPDHLAYFNALAGEHPEHVLVDSNLDWGQDLYRLRDTLAARDVSDSVRIAYFGTSDPSAAGVPKARLLGLHERTTGWIAASETFLAGEWVGHAYQWLLVYPPAARVGPSLILWHIPPDSARAAAFTTGSSPR